MTTLNGFEITLSESGDESTVAVKGEVDLTTAPLLDAELTRLGEAGQRHIRVDLRDVRFLDSQGIKVLVDAHKRLSMIGGSLSLFHPPRPVRRVLEVTGVERFLPIDES